AGLVVLYVTGVIGPSKDDDAAESAPPEYSFDDELCDKIDFAAFGPELSRDGEVEAQPQDVKDGTGATSREQIDCWVMYDHVDGGTLLGQLSISMLYFPTEQEAVDHYGPSKMAPEVQDSAETYEGSWDEGLIGQYLWDTGSDVQTDAIFRDGNVFGYVRFYWSGGEWDPDQMTTGVKDLAEQLAVQLDR
ncbi:MAG: hypothetical protein ACRDXX_21000, partial [Stackebrandtia sp.]